MAKKPSLELIKQSLLDVIGARYGLILAGEVVSTAEPTHFFPAFVADSQLIAERGNRHGI